ncbi:MAG: fumarylacetoacetate hydrolase family protein [Acidobacteriaceae bacterium]|nr:fumarylacetoacetate hydrolase family protein [Acidobacteriaceae bacterium]
MTGAREAVLTQIADILLDARRTGKFLQDLPAELMPQDMDEAYAVQDKIAQAHGEIGGWKIGAPNAEATPLFGPMPKAWMSANHSALRGERWRYRGLEAEIAFVVGQDLPARETPYTREEVIAAMASCHPVIEVLESAFVDPTKASRLASFADLQMHGGFVYGSAIENWQAIDWNTEKVTLTVDGVLRVERTGSNTSGDLVKLLPWLANEGTKRTGGLRKGQWITTGSWTGNTPAGSPSVIDVTFSRAGNVGFRFE